MSTSWTNTTVTYASINKTTSSQDGVPDLNDGFLFPAADNESFFQFGGETNWLFNAWLSPSTAAYQFTLNGEGNGSWSVYNSGGDSGINNITRPTRALAATVDNTFFILGGIEDSHSAQSTMYAIEGSDSVTQGGVVAFNTTVGKWTNSSMPEHLVRPHGRNGMLGALPTFGPRGLLLAAGTGTVDGEAPSLENITLYEPGQKTWHYQTATGDIPKGRDGGCNVGIAGDDGTYEMYAPMHYPLRWYALTWNLLTQILVWRSKQPEWRRSPTEPSQGKCRPRFRLRAVGASLCLVPSRLHSEQHALLPYVRVLVRVMDRLI